MTWWEMVLGAVGFAAVVVWIVRMTERHLVDEAQWPDPDDYDHPDHEAGA